MKTYKTKNYEIFKTLRGNRPVSLNKHLVESMRVYGYMEYNPMLVDEAFHVIDGQHRLAAAKHLGIEVTYYVLSVDEEQAMKRAIDGNHGNVGNWKLKDYVHMHACKGIECYKKLEEVEELYKLGMSQTISVVSGANSAMAYQIRKGEEFIVNSHINEVILFILSAKEILPFWKDTMFVRSVVRLHNRASAEQVNKVARNMVSIRRQVGVGSYMVAFENMINKNARLGKNISLS